MKMSNNKHKQQRLISSTLRPTFRLISFTHFAPFHFFFSAPQRRYSIKASDEMAFAAFAIEPRFGRGARRRRMMEAKKSIRQESKIRVRGESGTGLQLKRGEVDLSSGAEPRKTVRTLTCTFPCTFYVRSQRIRFHLLEQVLIMRYHGRWISNTAKK